MNATIESIDRRTRRPAVTSFFERRVDSDPQSTYAVLTDIDPMRPLVNALAALGLEQRIEWLPRIQQQGRVLVFGAILPLADAAKPAPGYIKLAWRAAVEDDGDGDSILGMSVEATATDAVSRERLLDSWSLLGPLLEHHSRRMLATVKELAEQDAFAAAEAPAAHPLRATA